jgi:hypothetical protein
VILAGVGFGLLYWEHDRIVNIAIDELNKTLKGELQVETSKVSLFKHFPSVGVALHNATLYPDKSRTSDPIFKFAKLYVGISIPDLMNEKYNVRRVSITDGRLDLVKEPDGAFNILKAFNINSDTTSGSDTTSAKYHVDLQKVSFKNVEISYLEGATGQRFSTNIEQLTAAFKADSTMMSVTLDSNMKLDVTSPTDTSLFRHKNFHIALEANYDPPSSHLHIPAGKLKLEEATFDISGSAHIAKESVLDMRIKGDRPDLTLITAFLSDDVKAQLAPFTYDGRIYFDALVRGRVAEGHMPLIEVDFGCEDAWFLNASVDQRVDDLGFKGYYFNGSEHDLQSSELHITNVSARPGKGVFKADFVMRDFTKPQIVMQVNSELELKFLGEFFGIAGLRQTTGDIKLDMDFNELMDLNLPEQALSKLKEGIESKLVVTNLSFTIPGHPLPIRNVNIHAGMSEGNIKLDSASLRIGDSDLKITGSLSDLQAFLHDHKKEVTLKLHAVSKKVLLKDLFAYDTSFHMTEEITGFVIGLELNTTVDQMLHPAPVPKGFFDLKILNATLKNYKHSFKDISAQLTVNDTLIRLRNLNGMVDNSDLQFSGRVTNYQLWFDDIKKGKTQIAFDFKSKRFALDDILGRGTRKYIPRGYRHEEVSDVWLRSKIDLRYDTTFKFMKAKVTNVSGVLKRHNFIMKDISGGVKYGNSIIALDTMKGMVGRTDFDVNMRWYTGPDPERKKKTNYFTFKSALLDVDELVSYDFAPDTTRRRSSDSTRARTRPRQTQAVVVAVDTSKHAKAFNIFSIPFSDFNVQVDIGKVKYQKLWMRDVIARGRMTADHFIHADTIGLRMAGGTIGFKGMVNGSDSTNLYLTSNIRVTEIDLEKVMLKLDHFGHDIVINKNIKGRLTGEINSAVKIHPDFVPILDKTSAKLDVKLYDGTLVDFPPMQAMAGYFKDKNLRLIRFDSIINQLSFEKGVLDIPNMNINSSLGSIQLSGKQSVDLSMEYYMRIPMKMVTSVGFNALFNKKQEDVSLDQIDEVEYGDADRKTRFVSVKVTGTPDDFKIALSKKRKG